LDCLLEVSKVSKKFGGLTAVKEIDLEVREREIVGLIGPNGAGKTTLLNCIQGWYPPTSGIIKFKGKRISGLKPHKICNYGIARTFQIPRPFSNLTVLENVLASSGGNIDSALSSLKFVGLESKKDLLAKKINVQELKMLDLARALATNPKLILVDEIVAGTTPREVLGLVNLIKKIREKGISILWVEHIMKAIMSGADRVIVLNEGVKIAEGTPEKIAHDEEVIKAYLGETAII
jgi:branched-chain amino acid transport system ATP-binding protein